MFSSIHLVLSLSLLMFYSYPFTAESPTPCSKYSCPQKNAKIDGAIIKTDAAKEIPTCSVVILGKYKETGYLERSFKKISGCSIVFQYSKKLNNKAEPIPGAPSGIPIKKNNFHSPAPSMRAASISAVGIILKNLVIKKTGNVEKMAGRMMLHWLSIK